MLPGAILWGASFPLALASVASTDEDPARLVGGVYAANTLGAIVGSLGASLLLVDLARHPAVAAAPDLIAAAVGAAAPVWREQVPAVCRRGRDRRRVASWRSTVQPVPGILVAFGRYAATQLGQADIIYVGEGWNASVAVSERANGVRNYHNAGKVQASSEPQDMRLQRMLGHLTTLVPENPARCSSSAAAPA